VIEASDAALVRACRRGNEEAWEALVHRYQRFVHSIPRRAGLDDDAAADVFQEVFAALVQGLDKIDDPDRVGAWILTTAKRATWRPRKCPMSIHCRTAFWWAWKSSTRSARRWMGSTSDAGNC